MFHTSYGIIFNCAVDEHQGDGLMATKSGSPSRVAVLLVALVALANFVLGIYHLTHQGWRSGVTELSATTALVIAIMFISRAQRG